MAQDQFLSGVVEGFYGRPWSWNERLRLVNCLSALGLNTYLYAPKDDLKHRAVWRELYTDAELGSFRELVDECRRRDITFIYALSPGLDVRFEDAGDRERLAARFEQLQSVGIRDFALLFDDLPLARPEQQPVSSLAQAHGGLANWVRRRLVQPGGMGRWLFCPTPYCDRMDRLEIGGAGYLDEIGRILDPAFDILWTGPDIVSEAIPLESIERLAGRLERRPVIWDNLFANDYDLCRVHCGPYEGRPTELRERTRGILLNPNNEFALNFVPFQTFAEYLSGGADWCPRFAYERGVDAWRERHGTISQALSTEDLRLLTDSFYLPHSEGAGARELIELANRLVAESPGSWGEGYARFLDLNGRIQATFERLTELVDRELFHAWSRYAWNLKEELQVIDAILAARRQGSREPIKALLPGTYGGGVLRGLERVVKAGCGDGTA